MRERGEMRRREAYTGGVAYWESYNYSTPLLTTLHWDISKKRIPLIRSRPITLFSSSLGDVLGTNQTPMKECKIVIAQCMDRCGRPRKLFRGRRSTTSREEVIMPLLSWSVVLFAPYDNFCAEDLPDNLVLGILGEGSRYRAFIFRS